MPAAFLCTQKDLAFSFQKSEIRVSPSHVMPGKGIEKPCERSDVFADVDKAWSSSIPEMYVAIECPCKEWELPLRSPRHVPSPFKGTWGLGGICLAVGSP